MPIITIQTNVSACQAGASFHKDITEIASEFLQKSQKIIWVMLETDKQLTMGATKEPTAIVSVECIGRLKPKLNLQFGTKLEEYLLQNLGIPKNRVVIKCVRVPALFCQFDGHLHDIGIEFDEDLKS
ncbi:MIF-like protein mif-2, partial [Biomphalaria glabrata]|uniref:L-dopachrome isomerase n=1 Tax=Biomphalaria glabrata TaxID=6526 RepID=C5MK34_BIOGL|nr:uncharacterized LOC106061746 [Biomphalaria glabrata]ACR81564.1 macrophage migration inhibitory factor 1 [Biomphalaria glabrata]